jgi:hypothetical protein
MNCPDERRREVTVDLSGLDFWELPTCASLQSLLGPHIAYLDLTRCQVGLMSAAIVARHAQAPDSALRELILDDCRLTDPAARAIIRALPGSRLTALLLCRNRLTDAACAELGLALARNPPLALANLGHCQITGAGCAAIAAALPAAEGLRALLLDSNCIFDAGAASLARALPAAPLAALSVASNRIWRAGASALLGAARAHPRLAVLDLSGNIADLELLARCLAESPRLTAASLSRCKVDRAQFLPFLEGLARYGLESLCLEGLEFAELPLAWPYARDDLWSVQAHFAALLAAVASAETLVRLQLGFLAPEQIRAFDGLARSFTLVLSDFGRTGESWLFSCAPPGVRARAGPLLARAAH